MADPKVEQQLRDFLAWAEDERARGHTNDVLHGKIDALHGAVKRIAADRLQDRQTLARYGRRIGRLENQVALMSTTSPAVPDWQADPSEITGTHQFAIVQKAERSRIAEIEERLDEDEARRRDDATWWRRQGWIVVLALLVAAVTGCVGFAVQRLIPPPPISSPPSARP